MRELDINKFVSEHKHNYQFKDFSDEDTYAIRELKIASQNNLLWSFIEELGIPNNRNAKLAVYYYFNFR